MQSKNFGKIYLKVNYVSFKIKMTHGLVFFRGGDFIA
jgi:hypothetical protein